MKSKSVKEIKEIIEDISTDKYLEYIDRLKNTEAIFNDKEVQNEFLESLKTQVNVEVEEQAEQMKREGRTKARDEINEKDLDDMVLA